MRRTDVRKATNVRNGSGSRTPALPVWEPPEYPKHHGGQRMVCFHEVQGPEWLHSFKRWSLRLGGHFMDEPGDVSFFLNMGNSEFPSPGRSGESKFFQAWTLANDGPPRRGQQMDPDIFVGKCFIARVEDCTHDSKGRPKCTDEVYSRITELIRRIGPDAPPAPLSLNQKSINQESVNQRNQRNQTIKGPKGETRQFPPPPGGVYNAKQ